MKAVVISRYGPPEEVMELREVPKPVPADREVLIRVQATAINDWEWGMVTGRPRVYRLMFGLRKPKHTIPGMELSGVVEAVGEAVTTLHPGDEVFGDISGHGFGTFAEYICIHENAVRPKPEKMSFEEAASLPHAGLLAYQGLNGIAGIRNGQKLLINGAGGGVGTFGFQIARQFEVEITGVDTGEKLMMMKSLGFDHVIDYKKEDFTQNGMKYDLILDCKSTRGPGKIARSLAPEGTYVTVGGDLTRLLQVFIFGPLYRLISHKKLKVLGLQPNQGLEHIVDMFEKGTLKSVIDGPYSLENIPESLAYFGAGKHAGKIVISLDK